MTSQLSNRHPLRGCEVPANRVTRFVRGRRPSMQRYWAPVNVNVRVDERPWKVLPAVVGNVIVINSRSVVEIAVAVRFDNVRFVPMTAREARTVVVVPPQV